MECMVPGRVIFLPNEQKIDIQEIEGNISESIGLPFKVEHSIVDVLKKYELSNHITVLEEIFGRLPYIARIPEGEEYSAARRLMDKWAWSAFPDYIVRPQSSGIIIDSENINRAVHSVNAEPVSDLCGSNCKIAVIDSGIDLDHLIWKNPHVKPRIQYDVDNPSSHGSPPFDSNGHGTLVARIINTIAPSAELIPIKIMGDTGSVSQLLSGLYVSVAVGPCDLINLSLSISCTPQRCKVCQHPNGNSSSTEQFAFFISEFIKRCEDHNLGSVMIAAAGNGYSTVSLPAALRKVISVGSFNIATYKRSDVSNYNEVPSRRFLLAPGGSGKIEDCFATTPGYAKEIPMHGTSFATAFVTGVAARYVCGIKRAGDCPPPSSQSEVNFKSIRRVLKQSSAKNYPGFDKTKDGLGILNYC